MTPKNDENYPISHSKLICLFVFLKRDIVGPEMRSSKIADGKCLLYIGEQEMMSSNLVDWV